MTVMIKDGKLTGEIIRTPSFLNGSPDCGQYPVRVLFDGADIGEIIKHAMNAGIIVLRKRIKNRTQAEALAKGITFEQMVSAQPKDSNAMAANIIADPDALDADVAMALLEKLQAKINQATE